MKTSCPKPKCRKYNYDIREFQKRSIVLLQTIDKICREHNLRYYIIAGTLLGAQRHKGFIPWDDDMDIALLRPDYDLLMAHADEWMPAPFNIVNNEKNPNYPKYFAKLEDTSTTLVERLYLGYAGGIYMDIFPLDSVPDSTILRAWHFYRFNILRRMEYLSFRDPYKHGHGLNSVMIKIIQKLINRRWVQKKTQQVLKEYEGKKSCSLLMTHDDGFRAYEKKVFGEPTLEEFEGLKVWAPTLPDGFLRVLYGDDYMTPPPIEQRRAHYHDFCDFSTPYNSFDINTIR